MLITPCRLQLGQEANPEGPNWKPSPTLTRPVSI